MRVLGHLIIAAVLLCQAAVSQAQTLRIAVAAFPPTLGNPFTGASQPSAELWWSIYDGLTRLNWSGGPEPALAVSWENTSPTTWVFHLRSGVTYHTGKPFTAQDVVDLLTLLKRPDMAGFLIPNELALVSGSRTLDDLTVEIETAEPDAILPKRLATLMMIDPALWDEIGVDGYTLAPVGTGPFRLTSFGRGNGVAALEANPASWRAPKGLQKVEYRLVADKTSRIQALLSDQIDMVTGLHVDDVAVIEGAGFEVVVKANPQVKSIALPNLLHGEDHPLHDVRVRRALNYAVDKAAIAKFIMFGYAEVASQGVTSATTGFNPALKHYAYDPDRARALLAEAGYSKGFPMNIEVVTDSTTPDGLMYQKVAQDLEAVGISVTLKSIPFSDYNRKYTMSEWGDADAFHLIWNNAAFQDPIRPIEYFSCLRARPFFCAPELVPLIKRSNAEMDPVKRDLLLQDIMARLHDLAPAVWLTNAVYTTAYNNRIVEFDSRPTGIVFESLILKED
jgi:peptide/nickel transport system substrate-binding protein